MIGSRRDGRRVGLPALKHTVVRLVGRERVNRLSAPYYDWAARRRTREVLARLPSTGIHAHLGCGLRALPGWVNVDRARAPWVDVVWDLRDGLPFADASCSVILGEHVIEHLSPKDAERVLRECYRSLETGGVLRLATPDAGRYARAYVAGEISLDAINRVLREDGQHLWSYDVASLSACLRRAGFATVEEREFGLSPHPDLDGIDAEGRRAESLYVEAVK